MKKVLFTLLGLNLLLMTSCNQGLQINGPIMTFDDLSSISAPGNQTITGSCSPDGAEITINCGGADSQTTCQNGMFTANNVDVPSVPASCSGEITDDNDITTSTQSVTDADGSENTNTVVGVAVDYVGPDLSGNWEFDFDLTDAQGSPLANDGENQVTLSLVDLSNNGNVLFEGDFLVGDDLATALPSNASGLDYATLIQPYLSGTIEHDQELVFQKRAWAQANGRFHQIYDVSPKQAVEVGIAVSANDSDDQQMAVLPIYSQFSYDNHSAPSPTVAFPHSFSDNQLTFGGLLSVTDGSAVTYSTLNRQCNGSYRSRDDAFDTVLAYILDGEYVESGFTADSGLLADAVAGAFGVTSIFTGTFGISCQDRLLDYHRFNSYIEGQNIIVIGGRASGEEVARYNLVAFRSF